MDAQSTTGVRQGDVLAGKYRIEKILGIGGMGVVVAAQHLQLETKVAIKFLLPESLNNEEVVGRFRREAQAASRIKSEFVARVSDVGILENGAPYMVMEYLEGCDLGEWLQENGRLPVEQAVEFVLQALEAIAEAHSLGVVHRDLKPANMYCVRRADGLASIKVLDFGISKLTRQSSSEPPLNMTRTSAVVGSPLYMSPEQLRSSRDVDMRTDIWSLGVILFQLLTGKAPFEGETLPELSINIAGRSPPRVRDLRPEIPEALEQVIARCLEKDREHRFGNVAELALALAPLGPPRRAQASAERIVRTLQAAGLSSPAFGTSLAVGPREPTGAAWGQTSPPSSRNKRFVYLGAAGVVAALGAVGLMWSKTQAVPSVTPTTMPVLPASAEPQLTAALPAPSLVPPALVLPVGSETAPVGSETAPGADASATSPLARAAPTNKPTQSTRPLPVSRVTRSTEPRKMGATVTVAPSTPKPNCDPPYTLDTSGNKHFKRECY